MLVSFDYIPPPDLSSLSTTSIATGIKLKWTMPIDSTLWATEIWSNSTNDRSSATLVKVITGTNHYIDTFLGSGAITKYYWIRSVGIYNQNNGNWHPVSSTGGIVGTSGTSNTADITANAITVTTLTAVADGTSISMTNNTWENILSSNITGTGNPFLINTNIQAKAILETADGYATAILRFNVENVTAGGVDDHTLYSDTSFATVSKYNTGGQGTWAGVLGNCQVADSVYGNGTANASGLELLNVYNFTVSSIPSGAVLTDIEVAITGLASSDVPTPLLGVRLCWDGADFPTYGGLLISSKQNRIALNTANTSYTVGGGYSIRNSWGTLYNTSEQLGYPITLNNVTAANFGLVIRDISPVNGRVISLDKITLRIYYTTKTFPYLHEEEITVDPRPADFLNFESFIPQTALVLTNGISYKYNIDWLYHDNNIVGAVPNNEMLMRRQQHSTTIQEFKR